MDLATLLLPDATVMQVDDWTVDTTHQQITLRAHHATHAAMPDLFHARCSRP